MKEHFVATGVGPLVLTARHVRGKRKRVGGDLGVGVKQTAACRCASEWTGECGRPECSGEFRGNKRTADAGANFVADHSGGGECPSVHPPLLRQGEEGRQYHHSEMTDTARVHV